MRISDWSSDVCSSDLLSAAGVVSGVSGKCAQLRAVPIVRRIAAGVECFPHHTLGIGDPAFFRLGIATGRRTFLQNRSIGGAQAAVDFRQFILAFDRPEEHTSELQSLMRITYAVFCLNKKKTTRNSITMTKV